MNVPATGPGVIFTQEEPDIVYIRFTHYNPEPEVNALQAQYYLSQIKAALARNKHMLVHFIIDASKAAAFNVRSLSDEARAAYTEAYSLPGVGKVAMVGMNPWLKQMVTIFASVTGRSGKTAFFDSKAEALQWLQSSKNDASAEDQHI